MVERQTDNLKVLGSIPSAPTEMPLTLGEDAYIIALTLLSPEKRINGKTKLNF